MLWGRCVKRFTSTFTIRTHVSKSMSAHGIGWCWATICIVILPFEVFLWSDIVPQPSLDYIKRRIATAVGIKASTFRFECAQDENFITTELPWITKQEQQPQQQHKPVRLLLDEEATRMGYNFGGIFLAELIKDEGRDWSPIRLEFSAGAFRLEVVDKIVAAAVRRALKKPVVAK